MDRDLAAALRDSDLARRWGPFTVLLSVYAVVLAALTAQPRVVVGVPMASRTRREMFLLGYFINTLPLALNLDEIGTFDDLCALVSRRLMRMLRYRSFDLTAHLPEVLPGRPPMAAVTDNMVTLYRKAFPLQLPGCEVDALPVPRELIGYPFVMDTQDAGDDGYVVGLEYLTRLAPAGPAQCLEHVLRTALADPARPLRELPVLDPDRAAGIDRLVNHRAEQSVPASLDAWFRDVVRRQPDRPAVTDETVTWTYADLDAAVTRVAQAVEAAGCPPFVAVSLGRRRDLVAVLLGVVRSGRAYVPLDPGAPPQRVAAILTQFDTIALVADPGAVPAVEVDLRLAAADVLAGGPGTALTAPGAEDLAYVIFTSGSSGAPKGVQTSHRNAMTYVAAAVDRFGVGADDVWCLFHSYAFDFAVWEMFGALLSGGRLVVVSERIARSPLDFAMLVAGRRVTVLNQTPSAFRRLSGVLTPDLADRLAVRWVILGGEALYLDILRPWYDLVGTRARIVNGYGPTECTVMCTFADVDPAAVGVERTSVIGSPLPTVSVAVVDHNLNRCPVGVAGELVVGGPMVSRGYLGRSDLTKRAFLIGTPYGDLVYRTGDRCYVRPDGAIGYLDRVDRQVQLRGYRIEPGEIEVALRAVPGVRDAHVRMDEPAGGEPRLVAWVAGPDERSEGELRAALRDRVPAYMIPSVFVRVPEFPMTINGKVDAAALTVPAPTGRPGAVDAAGDPAITRVLAVWTRVAGCGQAGPDDNFFEVGGTSMHVAQIHQQLVEEFGAADLAMVELLELTTARQLAARLARAAAPEPAGAGFDAPGARGLRSPAARRRALRTPAGPRPGEDR
jgi:amino acid adenylation domain-containing protein